MLALKKNQEAFNFDAIHQQTVLVSTSVVFRADQDRHVPPLILESTIWHIDEKPLNLYRMPQKQVMARMFSVQDIMLIWIYIIPAIYHELFQCEYSINHSVNRIHISNAPCPSHDTLMFYSHTYLPKGCKCNVLHLDTACRHGFWWRKCYKEAPHSIAATMFTWVIVPKYFVETQHLLSINVLDTTNFMPCE